MSGIIAYIFIGCLVALLFFNAEPKSDITWKGMISLVALWPIVVIICLIIYCLEIIIKIKS